MPFDILTPIQYMSEYKWTVDQCAAVVDMVDRLIREGKLTPSKDHTYSHLFSSRNTFISYSDPDRIWLSIDNVKSFIDRPNVFCRTSRKKWDSVRDKIVSWTYEEPHSDPGERAILDNYKEITDMLLEDKT